jgi:hypothetical protein
MFNLRFWVGVPAPLRYLATMVWYTSEERVSMGLEFVSPVGYLFT